MKIIFIIFAAIAFATCGSLFASDIEALIAEGDSLHKLFDNQSAKAKYLQALELDSSNVETLWRLSRAQVDIGEHLSHNQQEAYFQQARKYAISAIQADTMHPQAYLRNAIALGKIALYKGVFKSISLVKQVRENLEKCLEIDPDEPTAHYVMARTHAKLCQKSRLVRKLLGLSWANEETALQEYQTAIKLDDSFIMYRLDYAKLLIDLKRNKEAAEQLKIIANLPIRDEDDQAFKEEAAIMLDKY